MCLPTNLHHDLLARDLKVRIILHGWTTTLLEPTTQRSSTSKDVTRNTATSYSTPQCRTCRSRTRRQILASLPSQKKEARRSVSPVEIGTEGSGSMSPGLGIKKSEARLGRLCVCGVMSISLVSFRLMTSSFASHQPGRWLRRMEMGLLRVGRNSRSERPWIDLKATVVVLQRRRPSNHGHELE